MEKTQERKANLDLLINLMETTDTRKGIKG
jgi:hypothetical protein